MIKDILCFCLNLLLHCCHLHCFTVNLLEDSNNLLAALLMRPYVEPKHVGQSRCSTRFSAGTSVLIDSGLFIHESVVSFRSRADWWRQHRGRLHICVSVHQDLMDRRWFSKCISSLFLWSSLIRLCCSLLSELKLVILFTHGCVAMNVVPSGDKPKLIRRVNTHTRSHLSKSFPLFLMFVIIIFDWNELKWLKWN